MLILGQKKEPLKVVLREEVPATKAVRQGGKIITPASDGEPEASIMLAPITASMRRRAHAARRRVLGDVEDISELDFLNLADAAEAYARELIRLGALDWGGIGGTDDKPLALTPDRETRIETSTQVDRPTGSIDQLLADDDHFDRIASEYVSPDIARVAEKNASSASPGGTGGAATRAKTIAASPVGRKAKRAAAANARTASTRSKAKPAKGRGKR